MEKQSWLIDRPLLPAGPATAADGGSLPIGIEVNSDRYPTAKAESGGRFLPAVESGGRFHPAAGSGGRLLPAAVSAPGGRPPRGATM